MPLSGLAIGVVTTGGFLVYTGIKNVSVVDGLRQIMSGNAIKEGPQKVSNLNPGDRAAELGLPDLDLPVTGGGTAPSGGVAPSAATKTDIQNYARTLLAQYGWSDQWDAFNKLVMSESGWNPAATNPSSGAYGIPQALPASKIPGDRTDYRVQLKWMLDYIRQRYTTPAQAWSFHIRNNWY